MIERLHISTVAVCVLAAACSSSNSGIDAPNDGSPDGAAIADASAEVGNERDASGPPGEDSGASRDGARDARPGADAPISAEAGGNGDAMVPRDANGSPDAGLSDGGDRGDGGAPIDGGVSVDAAGPDDSGRIVDSGVIADGGNVPDAGGDGGLPTTQAVIAHRGASGHAPEHTIAAYELAISMGADYIEQDVAMTADGVLVCLHDATLDRTARGDAADCAGSVATKTLAQLKRCDMGSWFNQTYPDRARPEYAGQQIPTLEEVFQRYGASARYYIETKTLSTSTQMEPEILRLLNQYGLRNGAVTQHAVLIQSFDAQSLQRMHRLDAELPLMLLGAATTAQIQSASAYAFGIGPTSASVTQALLETAHGLRMAVHPYTVNEDAELTRLAQLCVDGMFTNFPDRYRAIVDAGGLGCPPAIR